MIDGSGMMEQYASGMAKTPEWLTEGESSQYFSIKLCYNEKLQNMKPTRLLGRGTLGSKEE